MNNIKMKRSFKSMGLWILLLIVTVSSLHGKPIKIMPLGDSITEGKMLKPDQVYVEISNYDGSIIYNTNPTYRLELWKLFKAAGYSFGQIDGDIDFIGSKNTGSNSQGFDADNEGWSGGTSSFIRDNIDRLLNQNMPDMVLLHIGTNDTGAHIDIGSYNDTNQERYSSVNNVKKILNSIFNKNPNCKVFLARIIKNSRAEAWGRFSTANFNNKIVEMVNNYPKKENIKIVNMETGAGLVYSPAGIDMFPDHLEENNAKDYHPNAEGFKKMAHKWFNEIISSGWLDGSTTNPTNGQELVLGGGNTNGGLDASQWSGIGMSHNDYVGRVNYQGVNYLNANPLANNGGIYQAINTEIGKKYSVKARLIGSNHYTDINNFTLASSYITIEDSQPTPTSSPSQISNKVKGSTPTEVTMTFTATTTKSYISLRGEGAFRYPNMSMVSVKEVNSNDGGTDITAPVITLLGEDPQTVELGTNYIELGATANDNVDGNITEDIMIGGDVVDTSIVGTYNVNYSLLDAAGNEATVIRSVIVQSEANLTNGQELVLGGGNTNGGLDASQWSGIGMSHNDYVGRANYQGVSYLNANPLANNGGIYQAINTEIGKKYSVKARLIGSNHYTDINNFTLASSYITIEDSQPTPTSSPSQISNKVKGSTPTEVTMTFTATTNTSYISLRGEGAFRYPNMSMVSVKEVNGDGGGIDTTVPVITLIGANPQTIILGENYTELGATANDNVDGNVTADIIISGDIVDTSVVGTYKVNYSVLDTVGNEATVTRNVIVQSTDNPNDRQELVLGGGNEKGALDASQWSGVGMSHNDYVGIANYQGINYLNANPLANNGGIYQAIRTEVGKTYEVKATLIGCNHYTDINNFTLGQSYISIEDSVPSLTSTPNYTSTYVSGSAPQTVELTFTATATTTYISVRGDTAFRYPNASMISLK